MTSRVDGSSGYWWAPETEEPKDAVGRETEKEHFAKYQELAGKFPGAYRAFRCHTEEDIYLYYLLKLIEHVPAFQRDDAVELLTSHLSSLTFEAMKRGELQTPPHRTVRSYNEIEMMVIPYKPVIEEFLDALGYTEFRTVMFSNVMHRPEEKIGNQLIDIFLNAVWLRENTKTEDFLKVLTALRKVVLKDGDPALAARDSLPFMPTTFDASIVELVNKVHENLHPKKLRTMGIEPFYIKNTLALAKSYSDHFPEEAFLILLSLVGGSEESSEHFTILKDPILKLMKSTAEGKRYGVLLNLRFTRRDRMCVERFEKAEYLCKHLGITDGKTQGYLIGINQLLEIDDQLIQKMKEMTKHGLDFSTEDETSLERIFEFFMKVPEHTWAEKVQLALTVSKPGCTGFVLKDLMMNPLNLPRYRLIVKYRLYDKKGYNPDLPYRLGAITEEALIRVLPLLDRCALLDRGTFVCETCSTCFPETDLYHAPPEKVSAIVDYIQTIDTGMLHVRQLAELVNHLLLGDNLQKVQNKDQDAVDSLTKLLEEKL